MSTKYDAVSQIKDVSNIGKCSCCQKNDASNGHTCPFSEDANDDHQTLCDCCDDCRHECWMNT